MTKRFMYTFVVSVRILLVALRPSIKISLQINSRVEKLKKMFKYLAFEGG